MTISHLAPSLDSASADFLEAHSLVKHCRYVLTINQLCGYINVLRYEEICSYGQQYTTEEALHSKMYVHSEFISV